MAKTVIYSKAGCPYCKKAREEYREKGIEFEEIDITKEEEAREYIIEEFDAEKVPVIVEEGKLKQIGFAGGG